MKNAPRLSTLERRINALNKENDGLKKNTELRNQTISNSLFGLATNLGATAPMNSFSTLAYYNIYAPLTINWTLLTYMYKTHGILQTAIDMPVLDAIRGGIDIHSDELDPDDIKDLQDLLEEGNVLNVIGEAMVWTRLYGGGAILVNADDGLDAINPLNTKRLKRVELYAANRWEIVSQRRYNDNYNFYGTVLDKSRVLTMGGKAAPYLIRWTLQGWGMSEMERMISDFNLYERTKDVVYELLKEAKIDVFQFENFTAQLASQAGTNLTISRVQIMNQLKSFNNAIVLDAKDKFEQKQITFAGLADVQKQNMIYIASALRMPLTKLFGLSASGFNSGEDDIENYNAMVESEVRNPLRQVIRQVINLLCNLKWGREFDIAFDFKPLRVLGAVEEEQVKTSKNARYLSLYGQGLLTAQEIMGLQQSEKLVNISTEVADGADPERPDMEMEDEEGPKGESDE